ncbi:MAG: PHP domain-containing protein, partial [Microbacteriaceae bacterium]
MQEFQHRLKRSRNGSFRPEDALKVLKAEGSLRSISSLEARTMLEAMTLRIDLHSHSSVSDGTETPSELVRQAQDAGLDIVAITDHDTSDGWAEASQTAHELGMGLVPGLELSTQNNGRSIHIVSYLVDPLHAELQEELLKIRGERVLRAKTIVDNISQDYDFAWELVAEQAPPGTTVGRPHIADALVKAGFSEDRSAAFREILHPSRGYTIPTYAPEPWAGIELIRRAGGVPVLAHPGTSTRTIIPKEALAKLVDAGLFGLEIEHPENLDERKVQL